MIPTPRLLWLLLVPAALALGGVFFPFALPWVLVADGLLLAVVLVDLLSLPRRRRLRIERQGPANLSVGVSHRFALIVENRARRALSVKVAESFPERMTVSGLPTTGRVGRDRRGRFEYQVLPSQRGAFVLGPTFVRIHSRFGLFARQLRVSLPLSLKVFPDVKILNTYALLARRNRIDLLGFRQTRGRGADVEFDRLREYSTDDDYRRIDWLATARHRKLITREYQVSRNQNVFFVVDCSRLMAGESDGLSNLDHALNATLMLASVALDLGDNVGLMAFDEDVHTFLPPSGGPRNKTALLHSLYDLRVSGAEPNYEQAFLVLQRRVRQRSLVVLLTNVMDDASFQLISPHLRLLLRRHLPLVVLLRDADLFALAERSPREIAELFSVGAAAELATWREQLARRLVRLGPLVLDITPQQCTPELINSYLRVKAEQLL